MISRTIISRALWYSNSRRFTTLTLLAILTLCGSSAIAGDGPWPSFTATTLSRGKVHSDKLLGQPTLLILTPSRNAAESTREWVNALQSKIDQSKYLVRDVLAVDLPFFMSEEDAIGLAKEKISTRYHDQTWILNSQVMEDALGVVSDSDQAVIVVLDKNGNLISQVHGMVTTARMSQITDALQSLSSD
ncbi:MAG: putative transcriptional regulator [Psychromonas sp.]|jgi:predicted transcriptional regulator